MDIKYGISATFNSAKDIFDAAGKVREKGYTNWECYTPIPIHGLDAQMGYSRSKVPCFTLAGGVTGFFTGMLIVWFMNSYDYPLIVGGKPYFSAIFPFPVFYELTILFAAFGFLFNMLTVFALYLDEVFLARVIFGSCCLSMIISIIFFIREIQISTNALKLHMSDMDVDVS